MKVSKEIMNTLEKDKMSPIIGNPDGKTVIYEFFDYNCGHCKNQNVIMNELIQANKDIKIILKNFPSQSFRLQNNAFSCISSSCKGNSCIKKSRKNFFIS